MCVHNDNGFRRFHRIPMQRLSTMEEKRARASGLKKLFKLLTEIDQTIESTFPMLPSGLKPNEKKRLVEIVREIDSFRMETKGRLVTVKEKIEAEDE